MEEKLYFYKAKVIEVIDGDTFKISLDLGFHTHLKTKIRLLGIDTPETRITKGINEKEYGLMAKKFAEQMFLNEEIYVKTIETDSFGRWLAEVYFCNANGTAVNIIDLYNKFGINKLSDTYKFDDFALVKEILCIDF